MALHYDLLEQARHLITREPRRPKVASLRRGVSAAYYGLFHLLTDEASRMLISGAQQPLLRSIVRRAFDHGAMKNASKSFASNSLPTAISGVVISAALADVARTFIDLQEARHVADYDTLAKIVRSDALNFVKRAETAFQQWESIRKNDDARLYLVSLLLWRNIRA